MGNCKKHAMNPDLMREKAELLRLEAEQIRVRDIREEMMEMADQWETLARQQEEINELATRMDKSWTFFTRQGVLDEGTEGSA